METQNKINWSALEYEFIEKNNDWFWALGIIVVAGSVTSIILKNYFFALLLIISGILLSFFAIRKPEMVEYELNEKGLKINNRLYPYENLKAFFVRKTEYENNKKTIPTLFVKTSRIVMPIMSLPINDEIANAIKNKMLEKNVTEEKMKEHPSEHIMETLGF